MLPLYYKAQRRNKNANTLQIFEQTRDALNVNKFRNSDSHVQLFDVHSICILHASVLIYILYNTSADMDCFALGNFDIA